MENTDQTPMQVSVFRGFSKPAGNMALRDMLADIAGGGYLKPVERLRLLIGWGQTEEAARVKRQLPGFTLSALYREKRTAEGITAYNDILILDFDKLDEAELQRCRERIVTLPGTLFCFRSPSGAGLKAGVHFRSAEADRLRGALLQRPGVSMAELETYHKRMFELCRSAYNEQCGVMADGSGSDIGRLCFVSYDPELYVNSEAIATAATAPRPVLVKRQEMPATAPFATDAPSTSVAPRDKAQRAEDLLSPQIRMEFQRCVNSINRTMKYEQGQRDTYLYLLGNKCYARHIPQECATLLAGQQYAGDADIDIPRIIANAYRYTGKTDRRKQEEKKPTGIRVLELLENLYEARRNTILENLEFRPLAAGTPGEKVFRLIRKEDYNNMYLDVLAAGINCQPHLIRTVVNSRFARDYNPFEEYFYSLPPWDGQTDCIDTLAQTLQTNHQEFWRDCFKRWIVGLVACALDENRENQLALIIKGAQGKGKSSWIRQLLPSELKQYYRNGALSPNNKDHMLLLSQRLLINLEEFEGMRAGDIADLKRLIGQDVVTERKAYGEEAGFYVRRASFIASTNEPRFLEDITGTRRFPTVTAETIDYKTPVDHAGVYAQALHLWKSGFRYWYEEEEFRALNAHNMQYVIASQEEELFYLYYRAPLPTDTAIKWMSVSAILAQLNIYGKILTGRGSQRMLIKVLEKGEFRQRKTAKGIVEYEVVFISPSAS